MKNKYTTVIGMVVCFMMMATFAWAGLSGVPNGTITDGNLVWLQNANCFGKQTWDQAMSSAAGLQSGMCGLTDKSTAGQWRLPTKEELVSRAKNLQGFFNVQSCSYCLYWSSSSYAKSTYFAWRVYMNGGYMSAADKFGRYYVWPVRVGQ